MAPAASEFLQQVLDRVQIQVQVLAQVLAQKFGMRRLEAPSSEVPSGVHSGVLRMVHSVYYVPVVHVVDLYWVEVHEMAVLSVNLLLPRHHLPMYQEEPCSRKVPAHLSK